ncbi:MAG: NAD(P)/FAD-dependent oxidoreductase [Hyphomicrobiaceae bacterium]
MRADYDAIAVGGGLAGSAFALGLATQGLRVAIIERTPTAQPKVCGDFLSEEAQVLLNKLGVDVGRLGAERITQFRMAAGNRAAIAPLPFEAAGFTRLKLDEALLEFAGRSGVEIIRGRGATGLNLDGPWPAVQIGDRSLSAKKIALATGKHNFRGWQRHASKLSAYKMTFELSSAARDVLAGTVQLVGYRGGYIGACNVEGGASTLCWLVDLELLAQCGSNWRSQLDELARGSDFIGDLVLGAEALFEKPATIAGIPFGYRRRQAISPHVFAVGDQIAVIPSFTGDGTSIAISSGLAAAEAILRGDCAEQYHWNFLRRLNAQFRWATAIELTFKSALTRRLNVTAIAAFPSLATLMTRLTRLPDNLK